MLILLEGPDGAGKTTLANELKEYIGQTMSELQGEHNVSVLHKGPPTGTMIEEYVQPLLNYKPRQGKSVICDRWHIGELVYPFYLNRTSGMKLGMQDIIEKFLRHRGALLIHVTAELFDLEQRIETRGDDLITVNMLKGIKQDFEHFIGMCSLTHVTYNSSNMIALTRDFREPILKPYVTVAHDLEKTAPIWR